MLKAFDFIILFFKFYWSVIHLQGFPSSSVGKEPTCNAGDAEATGSILGSQDPHEEEMATNSSILFLGILWTEEPGLQPMG